MAYRGPALQGRLRGQPVDASAIGAVPVAWQGDVASGGGIATSG